MRLPVVVSLCLVAAAGCVNPAMAQTTTGTTAPAPATVAPSLILICGPASANATPSQVCPNDANGNPQVPTVQQGYVLSSADYSELQAAEAPFDYTFAGACFVVGITLVVGTYFGALPLGVMVRMIGLSRW